MFNSGLLTGLAVGNQTQNWIQIYKQLLNKTMPMVEQEVENDKK